MPDLIGCGAKVEMRPFTVLASQLVAAGAFLLRPAGPTFDYAAARFRVTPFLGTNPYRVGLAFTEAQFGGGVDSGYYMATDPGPLLGFSRIAWVYVSTSYGGRAWLIQMPQDHYFTSPIYLGVEVSVTPIDNTAYLSGFELVRVD